MTGNNGPQIREEQRVTVGNEITFTQQSFLPHVCVRKTKREEEACRNKGRWINVDSAETLCLFGSRLQRQQVLFGSTFS